MFEKLQTGEKIHDAPRQPRTCSHPIYARTLTVRLARVAMRHVHSSTKNLIHCNACKKRKERKKICAQKAECRYSMTLLGYAVRTSLQTFCHLPQSLKRHFLTTQWTILNTLQVTTCVEN